MSTLPASAGPDATTPRLVLGTYNEHKRSELAELLGPAGPSVATLADFPGAIRVVEDGGDFAENATKKATQQARCLARWVLADDSGLEVAALGGEPGVDSAHFAGPQRDDDANNRLLLERLTGVPADKRSARYVCHLVLADPAGQVRAHEVGVCGGRIAESPRGGGGFGYDPLFIIREYHRTFAELGPAAKQALSHRARALRAIRPALRRLLSGAGG